MGGRWSRRPEVQAASDVQPPLARARLERQRLGDAVRAARSGVQHEREKDRGGRLVQARSTAGGAAAACAAGQC